MPALVDAELPPEILRWVRRHVRRRTCEGECERFARALAAQFSDSLTLTSGLYFPTGPVLWVVSHWWCEDHMGRIVDPTRYQFADKGRGSYLPGGRLPSC